MQGALVGGDWEAIQSPLSGLAKKNVIIKEEIAVVDTEQSCWANLAEAKKNLVEREKQTNVCWDRWDTLLKNGTDSMFHEAEMGRLSAQLQSCLLSTIVSSADDLSSCEGRLVRVSRSIACYQNFLTQCQSSVQELQREFDRE